MARDDKRTKKDEELSPELYRVARDKGSKRYYINSVSFNRVKKK